jgi:hypothetical protein
MPTIEPSGGFLPLILQGEKDDYFHLWGIEQGLPAISLK